MIHGIRFAELLKQLGFDKLFLLVLEKSDFGLRFLRHVAQGIGHVSENEQQQDQQGGDQRDCAGCQGVPALAWGHGFTSFADVESTIWRLRRAARSSTSTTRA